ncbi:uncharacterized protein E0L32_011181 [Thyridium curvatum]|uniref:Ribokinase n=1 Tax=Thyridium curvatum TaxID=1093900 RepID=A0A507BQF8_9PEZI|nr:uncharacterized protein E0L32_011181 [Thyridium curvatum]TPX19108.1 hypothetical protein E0L32_011181 [Thyridium curvatum]
MAGPIISVVGGLNMDLFMETDRMPGIGESVDSRSLSMFPGGKGANTAIAAHRASHSKPRGDTKGGSDEGSIRVFMNGAVGSDSFGGLLKAKLKGEGIDISGVSTIDNERSGTCVVIVETELGDSRNIGYEGANLKWALPDPNSVGCLAGGARPDLVVAHLGVRREEVGRVLALARQNGVDTLLNPAPATSLDRSTYQNVTHLVLNETEAALLSGRDRDRLHSPTGWQEVAQDFIRSGVTNVVLTLGARGAYYSTIGGERGLVKAEESISVVDTTGAGDTFVGNYAAECTRQRQLGECDISKAIARACKAAARTIGRLGAQEAIPWADEIDR